MTIQLEPPVKPLLHERVRDIDPYTGNVMIGGEAVGLTQEEGNIVADEIEKYYQQLPRDPEGNPVYKGMEIEGGIVDGWEIDSEGYWRLYVKEHSIAVQQGDKDTPICLPEPKVLDAEGVSCKKGETVWYAPGYITKDNKGPWKVLDIQGSDSVLIGRGYIPGEDDYMETVSGEAPDILTHREPDSLEKLRDDIAEFSADGAYHGAIDAFLQRCEDRLTAIMERDA